jgi:hypothetical protein
LMRSAVSCSFYGGRHHLNIRVVSNFEFITLMIDIIDLYTNFTNGFNAFPPSIPAIFKQKRG